MTPPSRLISRDFLLACASSFLFYGSFYFLLSTLPLYVKGIGGSKSDIGLVMGAFTVTAMLLRPLIGRLSDLRGRRPLMLLGALIFIASSATYNAVHSVPALIGLRLLHGVGMASYNTAAVALVADIAPERRRGEAMGFFGTFANVAMASLPAVGIVIKDMSSFHVLFWVSAATGVSALLMTLPIAEPARQMPVAEKTPDSHGPLLELSVAGPAAAVFCACLAYGTVLTFVVPHAEERGLGNPGLFFTTMAVALVAVRWGSGRLSDTLGRWAVILPGMLATGAALVLLAQSYSQPSFLAAGVVYGLGFGAAQPALLALAVDLSPPERRGAAMGTFFMAFELGIGLGAVLMGFIAQATSYQDMYLIAAAAPAAAAAALYLNGRAKAVREAAGAGAQRPAGGR